MKNIFLPAILASALTLALLGGFNLALADKDNNLGGRCMGWKCYMPMWGNGPKINKLQSSVFSLNGNGSSQIKHAPITRIGGGVNEFDVAIYGLTLTIRTASTTKFIGGSTFADLTVGKNVNIAGMADSANPLIVNAGKISILK